MNYIKELNAFKNWLLINDLPTGAISLWHTLMAVNNAAGWKERFNAPNSTVGQLTGLSKQGILDARKILMEEGLIQVENGKKGKAPVYKMISFFPNAEPSLDRSADQLVDASLCQSADQSLTIPKKKVKEKEIEEEEGEEARVKKVVTIYEENIGELSPLVKCEFLEWCEKLGEDVMLEAIKIMVKNNGRTFRYLEKILQEWCTANICSVEDVQAYETQKSASRGDNTVPFRKKPSPSGMSIFDELRAEAGL
ncbi:DnaD domain protein [Virgibacillus necropolis]|uniref:DnaD domain-containing protein n=1 Tax=Virgibacillus necropolis TaxID=163877 RepID=UPI00384FD4F3